MVAAAFLLPFFFDFLVLVALMALPLSLAGAGVGAGVCANEIPATARESARPRAADVIFFMMFESVSFWRRFPCGVFVALASVTYDAGNY